MSSQLTLLKQNRRSLVTLVLALIILFVFSSYSPAHEFQHPSIISSESQLHQLANDFCNKKSLALSALKKDEHASLQREHHAFEMVYVESYTVNKFEKAFRGDAHAARAMSLMWIITNDERYLTKAKTIISDWATTFDKIKVTKGADDQAYLEASWALPVWLSAADILKYYNQGAAKWKKNEELKFRDFAEKLGSYAAKGYKRSNWGASSVLAELSLAVYLEDKKRFNSAIKKYKKNLSDISTASGKLTADYLRDTWHPQYTLSAWVQGAEVAWHNGVDLYSITYEENKPRLFIVLDHFSKLFNGELPSPKGLKKGSYKNSHLNGAGYLQIAYNHYVNREQIDLQNASFNRAYESWYPGGFTQFFMSWDALTHSECSNN